MKTLCIGTRLANKAFCTALEPILHLHVELYVIMQAGEPSLVICKHGTQWHSAC